MKKYTSVDRNIILSSILVSLEVPLIIEEHHGGNISVKNTDEGICFVIKIKNSEIKYEN